MVLGAYATPGFLPELRSSQRFLNPSLPDPHLLREDLSIIHDSSWLVSVMNTRTTETQNKENDVDFG
jgi:hypothetical protein